MLPVKSPPRGLIGLWGPTLGILYRRGSQYRPYLGPWVLWSLGLQGFGLIPSRTVVALTTFNTRAVASQPGFFKPK